MGLMEEIHRDQVRDLFQVSALKPARALPSPMRNGRFTRLPLEESKAMASGSVMVGSLSFRARAR